VLEEWLKRTYPQIASNAPPPIQTTSEDGSFNPWANQQRIIDMFLAAARAGPAVRAGTSPAVSEQVDADVQIGLGVLFYGNSDYTLAKDCFEAALSVKPEVRWIAMRFMLAEVCSGLYLMESAWSYSS
jgi:peroxin-5